MHFNIFYCKMESLLEELENVIDSYKSTIAESGDVKKELSECEVQETEDLDDSAEDINT